jgi:hypothetical protein
VTLLEAPWANREPETDVCWPYPEIVDGYAQPLEGPGLGIEANVPLVSEASVNEEWAASKPFVPSLQGPRLRGHAECPGWVGTGLLDRRDAGPKLARDGQRAHACTTVGHAHQRTHFELLGKTLQNGE